MSSVMFRFGFGLSYPECMTYVEVETMPFVWTSIDIISDQGCAQLKRSSYKMDTRKNGKPRKTTPVVMANKSLL